jgi:hypothetical protein
MYIYSVKHTVSTKTHNNSINTDTVISSIRKGEGEVVSIYNSIIFLKLELGEYIHIV